jgi:hypothetical protein
VYHEPYHAPVYHEPYHAPYYAPPCDCFCATCYGCALPPCCNGDGYC